MTPIVRSGTTRTVLVIGRTAFKFAKSATGARCSLFEATLYRRVYARRRAMLCPVLACSPTGSALIMQAARPLTMEERDELWRNNQFPDWDYRPFDGCGDQPFEWKPADWGWLDDGRLVALDYSTPALGD